MTYQAVKSREAEDDETGDDSAGDEQSRRFDVEGMVGRVRKDAYKTAFRLRRQIMPHAITGAVLGGGLAAQAVCASGSVQPAGVAALLALTGFPAAVGVWRKVLRRRKRWSRRALIGGLGAASWLTVAPYGIGPEQIAALASFELALAARWWQTVRIGYPGPVAEVVAEGKTLTTTDQVIADWADFVGSQTGPLPGSSLTLPLQTKHGYAFTLQLARGKQSLTSATTALDRISTGLDFDVADIIIEALPADEAGPGGDAARRPSRCKFQVITDSPIRGDVVFDGPRRNGGLLDLGPYADGSGDAAYRLYTDGSMWSGVIIGGTGIGKSRVAENIVISALSGGDTEYWFLDPARGGSSPALAEHADFFRTMDNPGDMLDAALAMLDARAEENAYEGWTGFTPSPQRPGNLIVIDECHNPFADPKAAESWARIAREGRKVGLALLCISQYPGLVTFGGNEALRSSVMEGNALVLRTTSNSAGQLMAGLKVDPKTLPKIPGYAYIQGSEETGTRTAPFRNRNTDPDRSGELARRFLAAQPRPGLDMLAATATLVAGTAYRDRHVVDDRSASGSLIEALRAGHLPEGAFRKAAGAIRAVVTELGQIIAFPAPITLEDLQRPAAAGALLDLTDSQRAVLDAVVAGIDRPSDIEKAVELSKRQVATLLKELVDAGHLIQPKYGRYHRAA